MLRLLLALNWLLIVAGDVELNPGPVPAGTAHLLGELISQEWLISNLSSLGLLLALFCLAYITANCWYRRGPLIKKEPDNQLNINPRHSANFNVVAGGVNLSYSWHCRSEKKASPNDKILDGENKSTLQINNVQAKDEGYYVCVIRNSFWRSVETKPVQLTMIPLIQKESDDQLNINPHNSARFSVFAEGVNLAYSWRCQSEKKASLNDKILDGENKSTLQINNVQAKDEGYYVCVISNSSGGSVETKPLQLTTIPLIKEPDDQLKINSRDVCVISNSSRGSVETRNVQPTMSGGRGVSVFSAAKDGYKKLQQRRGQIIQYLASQQIVAQLANELFSAGCITHPVYQLANNFAPGVVEASRATVMFDAVLACVQLSPLKYNKFLDILKGIQGLEDLVAFIDNTVQISGETGDPQTAKHFIESSKAITEYVQYLRGRYQKQIPTVLTLQWPPPPTQKVLHLAMIQGKNTQYGSIDEDMVRLTLQGKISDILHRKTPIELKDIFQKPEKKEKEKVVEKVKRKAEEVGIEEDTSDEDEEEEEEEKREVILIEGAPGAGKSTLAWHICQQWGAGKLFQMFQTVVFIQLRDPAMQLAKSVEDILPAATRNQAEKVAAEFQVNYGKDLLFVMDGWDELPLDLHTNSIFYQLIASPETLNLHFSTVIITSRPIASGDLYRYRTISSRVEILGFTPKEVESYFTEALKGDYKTVQKLQDQLRERPMIEASCYLPLNAAIVTHLFLAYDHTLPTTLHGVFTSLVLCCLIRYMTKQGESIQDDISSLDDLPPHLHKPLKNISTLAYHGIMENKVTFSAMDLKLLKLPQKLGTLGLMQGAESFTLLKSSVTYHFLHLSVQELLASLYISRLPENEEIETFKKLFGRPRFASVFRFYAAFTKLETEGIRKIVGDIAKRKEKPQLLYLLHGLYEAHNLSLCQFVGSQLGGELGLSGTTLSPVDSLTIGYFISCICHTESGEFHANLYNCSLDDHRVSFLRKELCRYSSSVGTYTHNIVARDAGVSSSSRLNLNLSDNKITCDGAQALGKVVKVNQSLRTLDLSKNKITDDGARALGEALKLNQSLRTLNLTENKLSDDGAQALGEALKVNQSLATLNLKENEIKDDGVQTLGEALKVNHSLITLILWNNKIADDGAQALGEALKLNQSLRTLDLRENKITDDGAQALGEALKVNQSLTALNLQWNGIGNSGTATIAKGLQQNNCLKNLDLYHNQITDEGVKAIGEALSINQSLTTLDLRTNQIADEGASALGEALRVNQSLKMLDLRYNQISDEGARALDESLRVNQSLTTLRLWNRFISSEMKELLLKKFQRRVDFG